MPQTKLSVRPPLAARLENCTQDIQHKPPGCWTESRGGTRRMATKNLAFTVEKRPRQGLFLPPSVDIPSAAVK